MKKQLMIDYRDGKGGFVRKVIDNFEFCVRDGIAYFVSDGRSCQVAVENISQMYIY